MFQIDLATPALLFSAISLIMLAYTNRFLSYAQLVRTLKDQYQNNLSDPGHASDRHRQPVALRGQHVFHLHSSASHFRLYFRTGLTVAHSVAHALGL